MAGSHSSASSQTVLSVDLGRTCTKTCVSRNPEQVVLIPANVAHLTVEQVRRGGFESQAADPLVDIFGWNCKEMATQWDSWQRTLVLTWAWVNRRWKMP